MCQCLAVCVQVLNDDGHTTSTREKILTITVQRGWKEGTRITFPKEGDQGPNKIPGQLALMGEKLCVSAVIFESL